MKTVVLIMLWSALAAALLAALYLIGTQPGFFTLDGLG
jgi:hypothetical protein